MFEKEAEERARKLEESQTLGDYSTDEELAHNIGWNSGEAFGYVEGFEDGAEYVYNKLNVQLTKAKKIIQDLIDSLEVIDGEQIRELKVKEAEQFISVIRRIDNMPNEFKLSRDILGLWKQTVCKIRAEIKTQDTPALVYAKELCDKLEQSMCALTGGHYSLRYSIE